MKTKFLEPQDIVRRLAAEKSDRTTVEQMWDLIERFVMPQGGDFYDDSSDENNADFYDRERYDDTAVLANQLLAATYHANLTNQASTWFDLRIRNAKLRKVKENQEWVQNAVNHIHNALTSNNFHTEASEFYIDDTGFGTAFLFHDIADGKHVFDAAPLRECYFDEDINGNLLRFYRERKLTAMQLVDFFGSDVLEIEKVKAAYEKSSLEKFNIIQCIQKNDHPAEDNGQVIRDSKARPYIGCYVFCDGAVKIGALLGYYSMPVYCLRWSKFSGSKWGYSQAMVCMGGILTANELHSMTLDAVEKTLDPPKTVKRRGVIGAMDFGSRGITYVQDHDDVKEWVSQANLSWGEMKLEDIQASIRSAFFQDKLELRNSPAMTATEVNARMEQMQRLLGGSVIRAKSDFLDPMIERILAEEMRAGRLPDMPEDLRQAEYDVEYTGPLARMQRLDAVDAYRNWTAMLTEWKNAGFNDVDYVVDVLDMAIESGQRLGVPATSINDLKEAKTKRDADMEAAKAAQAAETSKVNAEATSADANAAATLQDAGLMQ